MPIIPARNTHDAYIRKPDIGIRAQSKQRIAEDIVSAGLSLFAQHGYDTVSTQQIAEAAGVTQRTLFRYFTQKSQILFERDYDYVARFEGYIESALTPGIEPIEAVKAAFQSLAAHFDANRDKVSRIYDIIQASDELTAIERGYQHRIDGLVARALDGYTAYAERATTSAPPSLQSRIFAAIIFAAVRPVYRAWLKGELRGSLVPYALAGWSLVMPTLDAARTYAEASVAAHARIDARLS